jgi:PHD/YefM family antitoxin component YafN of YafNO toxin-antitoxin module
VQKIISVTDFVRNATRIADEIEKDGTVYRITRGGRGSLVLVDEEYFEGWMAALDEMSRPGWKALLDTSRGEVDTGHGKDLETVAKEMKLEGKAHTHRRTAAPRARAKGRKPRR